MLIVCLCIISFIPAFDYAKYYANIILFPDISLHQANESPTLTVLILINRTIIHLLPIKSLYLHVSRRVNKQTSKQGGLHHLSKVC